MCKFDLVKYLKIGLFTIVSTIYPQISIADVTTRSFNIALIERNWDVVGDYLSQGNLAAGRTEYPARRLMIALINYLDEIRGSEGSLVGEIHRAQSEIDDIHIEKKAIYRAGVMSIDFLTRSKNLDGMSREILFERIRFYYYDYSTAVSMDSVMEHSICFIFWDDRRSKLEILADENFQRCVEEKGPH